MGLMMGMVAMTLRQRDNLDGHALNTEVQQYGKP